MCLRLWWKYTKRLARAPGPRDKFLLAHDSFWAVDELTPPGMEMGRRPNLPIILAYKAVNFGEINWLC